MCYGERKESCRVSAPSTPDKKHLPYDKQQQISEITHGQTHAMSFVGSKDPWIISGSNLDISPTAREILSVWYEKQW